MQGVVVKDEPGAEYICAQRFVESKPGYVFKKGEQGLGFYLDRNCPAPGTKGGYAQSAAARVEASKTAPGTGSVPAAAGKPDIKQEKSSLTVEVPGTSGFVCESPYTPHRMDVTHTPFGSRIRMDLPTSRTARGNSGLQKMHIKKRDKRLQPQDERAHDLVLLRQHVSQVSDLAGNVMGRLDTKRRRFDACRTEGECQDWLDWQHDELNQPPTIEQYLRKSSKIQLRIEQDTAQFTKGVVSVCDGVAVARVASRKDSAGGRAGSSPVANKGWSDLELACPPPNTCDSEHVMLIDERDLAAPADADALTAFLQDSTSPPLSVAQMFSQENHPHNDIMMSHDDDDLLLQAGRRSAEEWLGLGSDGGRGVTLWGGCNSGSHSLLSSLPYSHSHTPLSTISALASGSAGDVENLPRVAHSVRSLVLFQTLVHMCAGNRIDNLKLRPPSDAQHGGFSPQNDTVWRCQLEQASPTYGMDGREHRHIVCINIMRSATAATAGFQVPMSFDVTPPLPLNTSALVRSLYPKEEAANIQTYIIFVKRLLRLISQHLRLVNSVWEEMYILDQKSNSANAFSARLFPSPPYLAAFSIELRSNAFLRLEGPSICLSIPWRYPGGEGVAFSLSSLPHGLQSSRLLKHTFVAMLARSAPHPEADGGVSADGAGGGAPCTPWGYAGAHNQPRPDARHVRDLMEQMLHALQPDGSDKLVKVVKTAGGGWRVLATSPSADALAAAASIEAALDFSRLAPPPHSSAASGEEELDWGAWGWRWRGGWEEEREGDDGERADTCGGWLGGMEAWHGGVRLRDLSGDLTQDFVPLNNGPGTLKLAAGGAAAATGASALEGSALEAERASVSKTCNGEVVWQSAGAGVALVTLIKCWVAACADVIR